MSKRITGAMLTHAVNTYVNALMEHELLEEGGLRYQPGSVANGVEWSIRYIKGGTAPVGIPNGHLGMTAREAWTRLVTISQVLADISYRNESL